MTDNESEQILRWCNRGNKMNSNNIEQAEQAVKNAQNELDEAMRQLEAAKDDGWKHTAPPRCTWLIANRETGWCPVVSLYGSVAFFYKDRIAYSDEAYLSRTGWRFAKKGEVDIKW